MFFMYIFYLFGILGFCWIIWRFLVQPILNDTGIETEGIETKQTKQLEKLRREYDEMEASVKAADEGVWLAKEIKKMEDKINQKIKEEL